MDKLRSKSSFNFEILKNIDKIKEVTAISINKNQLEADFQTENNQWKEGLLPIDDSVINQEDLLLLGSVDILFQNISDDKVSLQKMLSTPCVQGIREGVAHLSTTLENCVIVLEKWFRFQTKWMFLSPIFSNDDSKLIYVQHINRFNIVKQRWKSIIKFTTENPILFVIISFPNIFDIIHDNNLSLDAILEEFTITIEQKKQSVPSLYFLVNDEIVQMLSTNDLEVFSQHIAKTFYKICTLDNQSSDINYQNFFYKNDFSSGRILGMIPETRESFGFKKTWTFEGELKIDIHKQFKLCKLHYMKSLVHPLLDFNEVQYKIGFYCSCLCLFFDE
jgi:hypothetical protein